MEDGRDTYTRCHVFVDDSNLWIEGQKYSARQLKLKDAGNDPRFRIDLGKFLDLVVAHRSIDAAFLYGSRPPPNDSVWNAARRRNFQVEIFDRAGGVLYGREKQVDMAMGVKITEHAYECDDAEKANTVFIVVTGDRDFTSPLNVALKKSIRVELWAWKSGMSTEFRRLANTEKLLTVREIDQIADQFAFTAYQSTRITGDINPARAIVFKDVPYGKKFVSSFANDLLCLLRLFYVTPLPPSTHSEELQNIAVEFPRAKPDVVLKQLERFGFHYKACGYAEYISERTMAQHQPMQTQVTCRYQALSDLDTSDYESTAEAISGSLNLNIDEVIPQDESSPPPATGQDPQNPDMDDEDDEDSSEWTVVVRRKAGAWTLRRKLKQTRCQWEIHCSMSSTCKFYHTEEEMKLFKTYPKVNFKYWKARECTKEIRHSKEQCQFAHGIADTWCLKCRSWGHCTDDCAG